MESYIILGIRDLRLDAVSSLLTPLEGSSESSGDIGVSIAETKEGTALRGKLVEVLGEAFAQAASEEAKGRVSFGHSDFVKNHCIARYDSGNLVGRSEVSNYDIIEDGLGVFEETNSFSGSGEILVDGEFEWVFGSYPKKLDWKPYVARK